jgi:endonuclease/exonuclease/phosphatase family metal-dependent hydrolase
MRNFRSTPNSCNLKEVHLQNRKFTWSNERRNPTMVRLDRVFCNKAWDLAFSTHILQALSTSLSDHCLLLLSNQESPRRPQLFHFENF